MSGRAPAGAPVRARRRFHLDAAEYTTLWRRVVGDEKPLILASLDHGRSHAERDALDAAAWRRLREAGHVDCHDVPDPQLVDLFAVLARPDVEVDVRVWEGAEPRGTVAAARNGLGAVAALDSGDGLRAATASPDDLPAALLAHLPEAPAMPGIPMTIPVAALQGGGEPGPSGRDALLRRAGVSRPVRERLSRMWAEPPRRRLQFGVARRDALGHRRRGPVVVTVVDTPVGRVLVRPAGREMLVLPVDRPRLRHELHGLLAALSTSDDPAGRVRGSVEGRP